MREYKRQSTMFKVNIINIKIQVSIIVKPKAPKPQTQKPKTKGPWAYTKISWATTTILCPAI